MCVCVDGLPGIYGFTRVYCFFTVILVFLFACVFSGGAGLQHEHLGHRRWDHRFRLSTAAGNH